MQQSATGVFRKQMRRVAVEAAQLPGLSWFTRPAYRRLFQRPYQADAAYYGIYASFAEATAAAPSSLPTGYDVEASGRMYRDRLRSIRVSDYPVVHWLSRLIAAGERRLFDLGGHIGISYYAFRRYLDYPQDLRWTIHDVPSVVVAGREWANKHDPEQQLAFTDLRDDAEGSDILMTCGALQYLDYSLAEFLQQLQRRPSHVLVNLTPMHPSRTFFTLQNIGFAICPYQVFSVPDFIADMERLGYVVADRWESYERHLQVPFAQEFDIDRYYGFYFRLPTRVQEKVPASVSECVQDTSHSSMQDRHAMPPRTSACPL